ncbi:MAG TPA: hypothetical protein VHB30_14425 [Solirubrobacteraceae bacterium]|jgi:hypothetical protein|nr:hypothetical protein [Solirubrobacteraceae bacterium]
MTRVLFLTPETEDYLADSLLHGLRTLLGPDCVDWPKREPLYDTFPSDRRGELYGRGFTLYGGLLEDIEVDRVAPLRRAAEGEFDLVVLGSVWQDWGLWAQLDGTLPLVVLDGGDYPWPFPWSRSLLRRLRLWWGLPRRRRAAAFFKRELVHGHGMRPIAFSIPRERIARRPLRKTRLVPSHVVDPEVAERVGAATSYAFDSEDAYYDDLRASRFGVTTKREGWDAMRHYELAASGAIPCFRDLERKPESCAPHGLRPGVNCLSYGSADELLARIESLGPSEEERLRDGALTWAHANSTVVRAGQFLDAVAGGR